MESRLVYTDGDLHPILRVELGHQPGDVRLDGRHGEVQLAGDVLPTAWSILGGLVSWMDTLATWADLGTTTGPLIDGTMQGSDWLHLLTSATIWVLLPLGVGVWGLVHREVK